LPLSVGAFPKRCTTKDAFDLWWEWADKPIDNKPTIDAAIYDAVMALSPRISTTSRTARRVDSGVKPETKARLAPSRLTSEATAFRPGLHQVVRSNGPGGHPPLPRIAAISAAFWALAPYWALRACVPRLPAYRRAPFDLL
jgi:hypothetical protein